MGGRMSKKTPGTPSNINLNADMVTQLRSYEAACKLDSDLQSFDTHLQARTNQEVVKVILDCKKDIWESQELFELVEEYFDNSLKTLDFCNALDKCLKRARDSQLLIHLALQRFEEESVSGDNCYARTLEELKNFKAVGDPFTEEFFQIYQSVYHQQVLMLEKLQVRKGKLDKKLKQIRTWKKVSLIIFVATVAAVLICSVVAAAVASPHVAAALAALTAIPVGSMGKWIDSLMKNYENALKGHKEVTIALEVGSYVAIKDLDNIRILVNRLEVEIESLKTNVDFAIEEEEGVKVAIEEIKKKLGVFMKNVEDLGAQADTCSRDIIRARTVVLQKVVKLPHK
ncbi:unnamed protein product [Vicia faba]|uniref:Uncharacterized protein n=1 Tax=Vicia faba TaxID=3906 RepID=A0AAV1A519_VICFA|nr:unnamed protein product [Vicia faba]